MSFLNIGISSCKARTYLFYKLNIMGADVLAMQGARTSAAIIFAMFNRINAVSSARQGLMF